MRKIQMVAALAVLCAGACTTANSGGTDAYGQYEPPSTSNVSFYGDSNVRVALGQTFVDVVEANGHELDNFGVPGAGACRSYQGAQTTLGKIQVQLANMSSLGVPMHDYAYVQAGVNEFIGLGSSAEQVMDCFEQIRDYFALLAPTTEVYFITTFPWNRGNQNPQNVRRLAFNADLLSDPTFNSGQFHTINMDPVMGDPLDPEFANPAYMEIDGIHHNAAGDNAAANEILMYPPFL